MAADIQPVKVWAEQVGQQAMEEALFQAALLFGSRAAARFGLPGMLVGAGLHLARLAWQYHQYKDALKDRPAEVLVATLGAAMRPIEEQIRRSTPMDTGRLRRSTATTTHIGPSLRGDGVYVSVRTGWRGRGQRRKVVQRVIEYGSHRGRAPQRILLRAVSNYATSIAAELPGALSEIVAAVIEQQYEDQVGKAVSIGHGVLAGATGLRRFRRTRVSPTRGLARPNTFLGRGILNA